MYSIRYNYRLYICLHIYICLLIYYVYNQRCNQPSQMLYNVIFLTESNFPIRSRYAFYFTFSLTFKAFVMFLTFLLFRSNLHVVLANGRGPKNSIHRDLFKKKTPKPKPPTIKKIYMIFLYNLYQKECSI